MRFNLKTTLTALLISTMAVSAACTRETSEPELGSTTATQTSTDDVVTTTETAAAAAADPIRVSLIDYEIQMPSTLPAGPTSFQVSNNGSEEHTFVISGNGVDQKLEKELKPLEVATLEVDLQPGTYQILCTYDGHDQEHDMRTQLTVTGPTAGAEPGT